MTIRLVVVEDNPVLNDILPQQSQVTENMEFARNVFEKTMKMIGKTEKDQYDSIRELRGTIIPLMEGPTVGIVDFDLGLGDAARQEFESDLRRLVAETDITDVRNRVDGLALACALIANMKINPLMVIVATGEGYIRPACDFLEAYRDSCGRTSRDCRIMVHHSIFPFDTMMDTFGNGRLSYVQYCSLLRRNWEGWQGSLHPDPVIHDALYMFATPWRENWDLPKQCWYWHHDVLTDSPEDDRYLGILGDWLRNQNIDSSSRQSLVMLDVPSPPYFSPKDYAYCAPRRIDKMVLGVVCDRLKIPLAEEIPGSEGWFMPLFPALPFLVALREFVWVLETREGAAVEKIRFVRYTQGREKVEDVAPHLGSVVIELAKRRIRENGIYEETYPFGLMHGFFEKLENRTLVGLSKALYNLIWAHTAEINVPQGESGQWARIFQPKSISASERLIGPVVAPYFSKSCVQLIWT